MLNVVILRAVMLIVIMLSSVILAFAKCQDVQCGHPELWHYANCHTDE